MSVFFHIRALSGPKMHFIFFLISRLWNKARRWDRVSTGFRISAIFLYFSSYCVFKTRLRQHVTREWKRVFTAKAPKHVLDVCVFKCDWTNTLLHMLSLKQHLYLSIFTTKKPHFSFRICLRDRAQNVPFPFTCPFIVLCFWVFKYEPPSRLKMYKKSNFLSEFPSCLVCEAELW